MISGKTLIAWGHKPGPWFAAAIAEAEAARLAGADAATLRAIVARFAPPPAPPAIGLRNAGETPFSLNVRAQDAAEAENIAAVCRHMRELMRVPTIVAATVMPDACPAGSAPGTIPVGGVAAARGAIHPGMHSADICCSLAVTIFGEVAATPILDAGMRLSHFGGGGRPRGRQVPPPPEVMAAFTTNTFLGPSTGAALEHFATQGDGNHFLFVGRLASSGQVALVTHHGSRKPGAMLYRAGMEAAESFRRTLSPETPKHNAWIPADTPAGEGYWQALQAIRAWTKANHFAIHDLIAEALALERKDRFWNEHNFVFRKSDGLFYHAKGATPAWSDFAPDSSGLTLIPLNMAEPILICRGLNAAGGLGFAPHGAGRNLSRTAYMRRHQGRSDGEVVAEQTVGIDARFFCGVADLSELPGAYKSAAAVKSQIAEFSLAEVIEEIVPIGCIMAGDWQRDAPWRRNRAGTRGGAR